MSSQKAAFSDCMKAKKGLCCGAQKRKTHSEKTFSWKTLKQNVTDFLSSWFTKHLQKFYCGSFHYVQRKKEEESTGGGKLYISHTGLITGRAFFVESNGISLNQAWQGWILKRGSEWNYTNSHKLVAVVANTQGISCFIHMSVDSWSSHLMKVKQLINMF